MGLSTTAGRARSQPPRDGGRSCSGRALASSGRLIECAVLDPRSADEAARQPLCDAVNIPFAELPQRSYELPPRTDTIRVGGPRALASVVAAWLKRNGRRATLVGQFAHELGSSGPPIGRLWKPSAFLAEILPQLEAGWALDLACGTGRDAVYLASCGWEVTAVDVLPDALARAQDLARRYAPAAPTIRWLQQDLEADPPDFGGSFDLITVFRYVHRPLLARLGEWLRPGGSLLCESFTALHRQRHGKPAREVHVFQPGELRELRGDLETRHYSEAWHGAAHTARLWAVRPAQV